MALCIVHAPFAGKLFRCAAPIDASAEDVQFLLNDLGIMEMVS
jgi:hypothetical protein